MIGSSSNNTTKSLSILIVSLLCIAFGLFTYIYAFIKGKIKINSDILTIAQYMTHYNKLDIIILLSIIFILLTYLIHHRFSNSNLLLPKLLILFSLVIFIYFTAVIWISTYNILEHNKSMFMVRISLFIFILLNSYSIYNLTQSTINKFIIILVLVLSLCDVVLSIVIMTDAQFKMKIKKIFPSLEGFNAPILLLMKSILLIGYT